MNDRYGSMFNNDISVTPSGDPYKDIYHIVKASSENDICVGIHDAMCVENIRNPNPYQQKNSKIWAVMVYYHRN